jgi:hypothetical protein
MSFSSTSSSKIKAFDFPIIASLSVTKLLLSPKHQTIACKALFAVIAFGFF